jgi:twitching motility protein PilT
MAKENGASDLHLEPGLPLAIRVRGALRVQGDPMPAAMLMEFARSIIGAEWDQFLARRSYDFSRTISGVRCRVNILQSSRGVGFAIRLLPSFETTLESLNLHSDFKRFVDFSNGLILISGPTGSGKTTTLAALVQTINMAETRHIVTIECPIEFCFRSRHSFIRQREVGRDTPSFEQALLDSLREDPDVLMVGEMRESETMRLTLNAAETGHLVLSTVHSSTCVEALQRVVSAFPAEIQDNVAAQLADCLIAVISQRLQYRPEAGICVPECEVLVPTNAVKNFIRKRDFFKIQSFLETGAEYGMWTFQRYRSWLDKRGGRFNSQLRDAEPDSETEQALANLPHLAAVRQVSTASLSPSSHLSTPITLSALTVSDTSNASSGAGVAGNSSPTASPVPGERIEIEPTDDFGPILKKP